MLLNQFTHLRHRAPFWQNLPAFPALHQQVMRLVAKKGGVNGKKCVDGSSRMCETEHSPVTERFFNGVPHAYLLGVCHRAVFVVLARFSFANRNDSRRHVRPDTAECARPRAQKSERRDTGNCRARVRVALLRPRQAHSAMINRGNTKARFPAIDTGGDIR